jgi:hypothetical protein
VDQPAEEVSTAKTIELDHLGDRWLAARRRRTERRPLCECTVRSVLVVMRHVRGKDVLEAGAANDEDPIEALAADAADPAFGVRPRLRRSDRRLDHKYALGAEDFVEVAGEFGVSITEEKPQAETVVVERHEQVARLLGHPAAVWVRRDTASQTRRVASSTKNKT